MKRSYDGWKLRRYWRKQAFQDRREEPWCFWLAADWLDAQGRYQ